MQASDEGKTKNKPDPKEKSNDLTYILNVPKKTEMNVMMVLDQTKKTENARIVIKLCVVHFNINLTFV